MDDREEYGRLAELQFDLARRATDPAVWNAHFRLATLYLTRSQVQDEPGRDPPASLRDQPTPQAGAGGVT